MKRFFSQLFGGAQKLGDLLQSKATLARRAVLKTEERERAANEAERLDRLRNPGEYRGR